MRKINLGFIALATLMSGAGLISACSAENAGTSSDGEEGTDETGELEVALTSVPQDVACLKVSVSGSRAVTQLVDVVPGSNATYPLARLPLGIVTISAEAYSQACNAVPAGAVPAYVTASPVSVRVDAVDVNSITLSLIRNGRIGVGVDFEAGPQPYLVPVENGITTKALFTVGDTVNNKPNGTPYRMVGIPDGLGAYDNGDGTFSLLMNHEISSGGVTRAHGANGAFVSRWKIRKSDMTVLNGEDLIQTVSKFDPATAAYLTPATGNVFSRFCSADLAPLSAFYDAASGSGFNGRLYMNGEETGNEGKAWIHGLNGTTWEFPRMGKQSWENIVANPATGLKTAVIGLDDSTPGQVYLYVGTKGTSGNAIQQAGLTNGALYGVAVASTTAEPDTGIAAGTAFSMASLGNVETSTGANLETAATTANVTKFNRPEDGAWDPSHPSDFYFVTTASFTTPSRLWRLHFSDLNNLTAGGTIDMLLDGTEGQKMFDNITIDTKGHVYLLEDVGNQAHIGKVWRYTIATDTLTMIAQHNLSLFTPGATGFLTQDEEASGIIDASSLLGAGWFLVDVQAHYATDSELVEGGQLLALYDPASAM
ncbi:MAG TPA: hypothetical protein VHM70_03065 [Polyangiaceae bacterium]|jgi:hypothetical protein|nr:hypothetical protein [Polyangiaceae bacterium]